MPYILRVATNNNTSIKLGDSYDFLTIFGDDYNTEDGTCERDYIHVVDLAIGHQCALQIINKINNYKCYNLGTGKSISILKLISTFCDVNKVNIPYKIQSRRTGDLPIVYCDNTMALKELQWDPKRSLMDMCKDCWNFELKRNI